MSDVPSTFTAIPTNIITGFLGVGKTSAILHLLKAKPANERWAILVNEFGEIGVDGSLFEGEHTEGGGVYIREVPGGCMCCAAGLPMHIALNQLLQRSKPHRLLIEPTGLGHPVEVLQTLSAEHYRDVLTLEKIITLVDARKLSDSRYTQHEIFNQQITIADVVVGNKKDLYREGDFESLEDYARQLNPAINAVKAAESGKIDVAWLAGETAQSPESVGHLHGHGGRQLVSDLPLPECGYLKAQNQSDGFSSVGWRFDARIVFVRHKVEALLNALHAERIKAVFITDDGLMGYNRAADNVQSFALDSCAESRIEIISTAVEDSWQAQLLACRLEC